MLKLKKSALAVLAFASTTVFSGTMGSVCTPGNATVPCEQSAWSFGAEALYLQASMGTFIFPNYTIIANNVQDFQNPKNLWGWGFMVEGAYHFNTGNDLNLNWYHLNESNTVNQTGPVTQVGSGSTIKGSLVYKAKPQWDAVNLEFGQHVDYNQSVSLRYHGGAEYVHINMQRNTVYYNPNGTAFKTLSYNGFGPRAGIDAFYSFNNGLSVYTKSALGLYAGTTSFKGPTNFDLASLNGSRKGSALIVVPSLEAKLGASYHYAMAQGDVSLDAGWMWINYFQALMTATPGLVHSDNFAEQGPFVGLKWVGNIA